ncbi:MAG: DUF1850 domain-containing protein [Bacillota bacterium]
MSKKKFLIIIFLVLIIISTFIKVNVLEVYIFDNGERKNEIILQFRVKKQDEFIVKWTHSVSKQPVLEKYNINNDLKIETKEMIFDTFSANLPATPDYNTKWEFNEDSIRVYNFDRTYENLPIVIGEVVANHRLVYNKKKYYLKDIYKPGGFVKVRITEKNIYKYLKGRFFSEFKRESIK